MCLQVWLQSWLAKDGGWLQVMLQPQAKTPKQIEREERALARQVQASGDVYTGFIAA